MAKIGTFQLSVFEGTLEEKQELLLTYSEKCLKEGADLVLMPEAYQYTSCKGILKDFPKLRGINAEWMCRCSELARKYHAYVVPWDYWVEDDKVYNSSYILDREGNLVGRYDKCNLTYFEHVDGITQGMGYKVFDLDIGKVGIMICFDNYFPETTAILGSKGAQLVLYPLYGDTVKPQWELKFRTRAVDYSMCIVSNQIDCRYDTAYSGAVDQYGNVVARLEGPGMHTVVELDLNHRVKSHTFTGQTGEDLRDYLHKLRNYQSYGDIVQEGYESKAWEEIFTDCVPVP